MNQAKGNAHKKPNEARDPKTKPLAALVAILILATVVIGAKSKAGKDSTATEIRKGPVHVTSRIDRSAVLQGGDGLVRRELVIEGQKLPGSPHQSYPTDLTVVLDRSGSMSGVKMDHARAALLELIEELGESDRFALVSYSSSARMDVPMTNVSTQAKARFRSIVRSIGSGGGTNMSAGLDLAIGADTSQNTAFPNSAIRSRRPQVPKVYAGRVGRMILISDGLANEGDATWEGLSERARRIARAEDVLSTVGVGADFNEYLMSSLADSGTGNYYYLENAEQLAEIFASEFEATRETVATAVAVTLSPGESVEVIEAAGYPLEKDGKTVRFHPGSLFAGQKRTIWVTYRIPTGALSDYSLGSVELTYRQEGTPRNLRLGDEPRIACLRDEAAYFASVDRKTYEDSVVQESYSELQEKVAMSVSQGKKSEAMQTIEQYRTQQTYMNRALGSKVVDQNIAELDAFKAQVDDAFSGADQSSKQNALSKQRQLAGRDARRAGSKKR